MLEKTQAAGFEAAGLAALAFLAFLALAGAFSALASALAAGAAGAAAAGAEAWAKAPNEKVAAIRAAMILFMMNVPAGKLDKELIARVSQRGPIRVG